MTEDVFRRITGALAAELAREILTGAKIAAIKAYRTNEVRNGRPGGLKEAKEAIEAANPTFDTAGRVTVMPVQMTGDDAELVIRVVVPRVMA